jgi:5-hydroxyisourate hydrolase
MSQITTHVLDTSSGKPASGIKIELMHTSGKTIAKGITNNDGRIGDLLDKNAALDPGKYKLFFFTGEYYRQKNIETFYPFVEITFETTDREHYHVPLLLNPFGYSTYRGS